MTRSRPVVLVICDGWGYRTESFGNAIAAANTPNVDALMQRWPWTTIEASGLAVGLPAGQQGNSEVGHLTIGSGRILYQPLTRINNAIEDGSFFDNRVLIKAIDAARDCGRALHCLGLVSPGGVHSHQLQGVALAKLAKLRGLDRVYFHVFTDGRDEPPSSARGIVAEFIDELAVVGNAQVASISGRYYAMDRDQRWDRTQTAYDVITGAGPSTTLTPLQYIDQQYAEGITDEFIVPVRFADAPAVVDGDSVVFWNFRPDRARQLIHAFVGEDFKGFVRSQHPKLSNFVTFTEYEKGLPVSVAFPREDVTDVLAHVVSDAGMHQFHVAETEKYAHVTYFINGGREEPFGGEERMLVPSPKVATYDTTPEMSAVAITDLVVAHIESGKDSLIIVNFANPDMVGHTGDLAATVRAVECVNKCLGRIVEAALSAGEATVITADHGNAEEKIDAKDNSVLTAHTTAPVPLIVCGTEAESLVPGGGLQDVAPTVLEIMDLPRPPAMTGSSLLKPNPSNPS